MIISLLSPKDESPEEIKIECDKVGIKNIQIPLIGYTRGMLGEPAAIELIV
jgi:hypothetical protein